MNENDKGCAGLAIKDSVLPVRDAVDLLETVWTTLLDAANAYLALDPDPRMMIGLADKQTHMALGKKAQIARMCDGRSGLQIYQAALAQAAPASPASAPVDEQPFMYGIMMSSGKAHMDEGCVSTDAGDLSETVFYLNDEQHTGHYKVVPVYTRPVAALAPAEQAGVPEAMVRRTEDIRQRMASPTSIPRSTLLHYTECLLAHIAMRETALPPVVARKDGAE